QQPHDGHRRYRLARARLSDDAEHFALVQHVAHPAHGSDETVIGGEAHGQVIDAKDLLPRRLRHVGQAGGDMRLRGQRRHHARTRVCRGSNASRSPSPMKFTDSAIATINRPGHQNSHGRDWKAVWYWLTRLPSETSGGWPPSPRNDSAVSSRIPAATVNVAVTVITLTVLGRMCLWMIRHGLVPTARADSTNSFSRRERTSPRTSLARFVQVTKPST